MKKFVRVLCAFMLFSVCSSVSAKLKIVTRPTQTPPPATYRAVLVGINEFSDDDIPNLRGSVNDAEAFNTLLLGQKIPATNITKLISDGKSNSASQNLILAAVQEMASAAQENDTIIFMFSGHTDRYGLVTSDTSVEDAEAENALAFERIFSILFASKAKNKWIFIDSHINLDPVKYPQDFLTTHGFMIVHACGKEELAFENPGGSIGCFTMMFAKGFSKNGDLNSDRKLTLKEVLDYTRKEVPVFTKEKTGHVQTPTVLGEIPDVELIFVENVVPEEESSSR